MKRWYDRSIRNKLTAVVLVAVIPAVLLASANGAWRDAERRLGSKVAEIEGIATALAATVSEPLASGSQRQVANALKGIGAIPGIVHVGVADRNGGSVFHFGAGIVVRAGPRDGSVIDLGTFPVHAPILHSGTRIGTLTLVADISEVSLALIRNLGSALIAGLVSALAGMVASYRMQRSITAPIAGLTEAMREVQATKDFSRTAERTTGDETGTLVDAFNDMLTEIRTRDADLTRHREGLEQMVAARTRELETAVDAAERANAAKSSFLATMSHEIRTPMNGMLVMAELLAASELTPRAQRHCEVILRSGQTLLSIINDILDLSKIEAGRLTLEQVPVDTAGIVDDVLKLFSERAASKGLELASLIEPGVPETFLGDPVRISQILSNLVNNALKFTERGGVLVRVAVARQGLAVSVTDTGIGIPTDKLATIFDPFTQAEQSTTRRYGGTGIGLTICRRLVDAMGGEFAVSSEVGRGSTFAFNLPAAVARATAAPAGRFSGTAVIVMPAGPVRTVLEFVAREVGLDPVAVTDPDAARQIRDARLVLIPADLLVAHAGRPPHLTAPVIALSRFGDAHADGLVRSGDASDVVELPLSGREARDAVLRALSGLSPQAATRADRRPLAFADSGQFRGVKVLAADDSAVNREVLIEALRRLGIETHSVEDGEAAVEAVKTGRFDLVFMDGSMPVMDGFSAAAAIRAWERETGRPPLPVVGLSAHVLGGHGNEVWRAAGMSDFISKPFTLAAIRRCLETWIGDRATISAEASGDVARPAQPTAPDGSVPILDREVLASIREMEAPGDNLVERVVELFREHAPRLADRLSACGSEPGDPRELSLAAHALKSLCRNVGAARLGDICGEIEAAAREGRSILAERSTEFAAALTETLTVLSAAAPASRAA